MDITTALEQRHSVRAFLDKDVDKQDLDAILEAAQRAPSGGNLQPWLVYVTTGADKDALIAKTAASIQANPFGEPGGVEIYPPKLKEPYKARRGKCGEDMYEALGIERDDKPARIAHVMKNFTMFGAPVGMFFAIDETMGQGQWAHLGMYIQTVMLLAQERGLGVCPQEAWALRHKTVHEHFGMPAHVKFYCGLAIGYEDTDDPINTYRTERAAVNDIVTFRGF